MNNEELIEWAKANLQEVQELKEKVEITKRNKSKSVETKKVLVG